MSTNAKIYCYIGSYADAAGPGIYTGAFEPDNGKLTVTGEVSGLQNPTFLTVDDRALRLYAMMESKNEAGERIGAAAAYDIEAADGSLTLLNKVATVPGPTCHIELDRTRRNAAVSSYHGGLVGLNPIGEDGRLGDLADLHRHEGSSVLPVQDRPRAHSVTFDRNNRFAVACDLGADRLVVYRVDAGSHRLVPHGATAAEPGAGPRHMAFHPRRPLACVINELNSTVSVYAYDEESGVLSAIGHYPTLPDSYTGANACADIHFSPDGRFLYGSNRGHESIVVFAVDAVSGALEAIQHASVLGEHPRNFALSPDGRFLLVANQNTDSIVTFARDADSGRLHPTGDVLTVSKPVCLKFLSV